MQGEFDLPRLSKRLSENRPLAKVHIAAFHHPMDCKKVSDEKNLLKNRNKVMEIFQSHKVDLIVGGHIHDPFVNLSKSRYPSVQKVMVVAVAGTCMSSRTRPGAPNSFNLIEVDTRLNPKITISRFDQRRDFRFSSEAVNVYLRNNENNWFEETR